MLVRLEGPLPALLPQSLITSTSGGSLRGGRLVAVRIGRGTAWWAPCCYADSVVGALSLFGLAEVPPDGRLVAVGWNPNRAN